MSLRGGGCEQSTVAQLLELVIVVGQVVQPADLNPHFSIYYWCVVGVVLTLNMVAVG